MRTASWQRAAIGLASIVTGCFGDEVVEEPEIAEVERVEPEGPAHFVGTAACVGCHAEQAEAWRGSHHDRAMDVASAQTVLGDFDDATFTQEGVRTTFSRDGERFLVRTQGADGALQTWPVGWVLGVDPLQQLLIAMPDGRIQPLDVAWDARPPEAGGQRWYSLHPDEPRPPGDPLHWTGPAQTWNTQCAACHTTAFRKGYDEAQDRFSSTWTDGDVGCEACHGPGSLHVARVQADPNTGAPLAGSGLLVATRPPPGEPVEVPGRATRDPSRGDRAAAAVEVERCGRCHALRAPIAQAWDPTATTLLDAWRPSLVTTPPYHPDGQIDGEVYVYGSFRQSRMYAAGVSCTDCHEPHAGTLRAPGDGVCQTCHPAEVYATADHDHHDGGGVPGCIDCHMPAKTYMGVDVRHDHSLRVPRPDVSDALGTPDACDACHGDRPDGWSSAAVRAWLGRDAVGLQDAAAAFSGGDRGAIAARDALAALVGDARQPSILRASALARLRRFPGTRDRDVVVPALQDVDPLVRVEAVQWLERLTPDRRAPALSGALRDPVRAVRVEAARLLAELGPGAVPPKDQGRFVEALTEWREGLLAHADLAASQHNLGNLARAMGRPTEAVARYRAAVARDPSFEPAWVNLVDTLAASGDEAGATAALEAGLAARPDSGALWHARGLHQVRAGQPEAALGSLREAVARAPDVTRYRYVLAVALDTAGDREAALATLEEARGRDPSDEDVLRALLGYLLSSGARAQALDVARDLERLVPEDRQVAEVLRRMKAAGP